MKIDIRQILDIAEACGYTLIEKVKPQSKDYWNIDAVYELENEYKRLTLTFTTDPLLGYLSAGNHSKRKQKPSVTLDELQIILLDKASGETAKYALDLRNAGSEGLTRLRRLIT